MRSSPDAEAPLEIDVDEVHELLRGPLPERPRLIDCREPDEWRICRIEGAELAPLSAWGDNALPRLNSQDERMIIYCHHGMRSLRAAEWLRSRGWRGAQSMRGGIAAWADELDSAMPRY